MSAPELALDRLTTAPFEALMADLKALFAAHSTLLGDDVPTPRVTFGLETNEPETFHVFVLTGVRDFRSVGFLTNQTVRIGYTMDVVLYATADTTERASWIANSYLAPIVQVALCDATLDDTVDEVSVPEIADYRAWADPDGRRHAGYRVGLPVTKTVAASAAVKEIFERLDEANES